MPDRITKVQRWLDLIAYLVGRRLPVSVAELMERLPAYARDWAGGDEKTRKSVRRKFERDKDELRNLGIPIETVPYTVGALAEEMEGYLIRRRDFYLPYLKLLEEEKEGSGGSQASSGGRARVRERAPGRTSVPGHELEVPREAASSAVQGLQALANLPAFPLATAARSALRKITFDLESAGGEDARILFAVPPETARAGEHTRLLAEAVGRRKTVRFTYHGIYRGQATERRVRPYGLLFQHAHWYLVAWDEDREGERLFRVDRMAELEVNPSQPNTPDFQAPDDAVLEAYRDREPWELGEENESFPARLRFRFPTSLWAERNGYGTKVEEDGEDGSVVREFQVRQPHALLRWVLSLGGEADIESPPELRDELRAMAREVAALYEEEGDG